MDQVKTAVSLVLEERGYSVAEIDHVMRLYKDSTYKDGIKFTKRNIKDISRWLEDHLKLARDEAYIGTHMYQGIGYFWGYRYRFWMRGDAHGNGYKGVSIKKARRLIHKQFLDEGLELSGETRRHDEIIDGVFGANAYLGYKEE